MQLRKNSLANNYKIEKIRLRADFFLNFAAGKISLSRGENITATNGSCALRARGDRVNTSLHSGSIDSVQNVEASFAILKHGSEG